MRMDALHYALLAVLVLLVFYAASTFGLFKEGNNNEINKCYKKCLNGYNLTGNASTYDNCVTNCNNKYGASGPSTPEEKLEPYHDTTNYNTRYNPHHFAGHHHDDHHNVT